MAEEKKAQESAPRKKSKVPLVIGLVLMLGMGCGGFIAVYSGLIFESGTHGSDKTGSTHDSKSETDGHGDFVPLPAVAFVPLDPLVINLGHGASNRHLRFRAELEVEPEYQSEVASVLPRVLDVLNSYLRAVSISDLEDPTALIRIRAQMLRRVKIVTGEGRVRDLLIMEFVLN